MAFSFIKKVFTFGPDKSAEEKAPDAVETKTAAVAVEPVAEVSAAADVMASAPPTPIDDLPVAADPVLPEEMDTAGGPSADSEDAGEDDVSEDLPTELAVSDVGLVPLEWLGAEAEVEPVAPVDTPPGLPAIPATGGGTDLELDLSQPVDDGEDAREPDGPTDAPQAETGLASDEALRAFDEPNADLAKHEADGAEQDAATSLPPPVGGMPGREGGEATAAAAAEPASVDAPILPKGFATGPAPEPVAIVPPAKLSWFQRLRAGLARTSSQLTGQISALFTKRKLDDDTLQDLEDLLIQADLGVETAMRVTDTLASERYGKDVSGEDVSRIMASEIAKVLKPVAKPLQLDLSHKPHVILVVGVNGTGKTTTIGKLAAKLSGAGLKVMVAAGDTFRAAAIEQLKIWAERTKSEFIGTKLGADAAGLAYDAFEQAKAKKCDVLIIDTAGRLQNKAELMAELEKIVRVLGKLDPDAPHTVLQTLDATTGQNALNQVEIFRNVAGVNGLIMTKLDGTARGGILVAISAKHKLPVYFIGVGEGVDDLEPFEAEDFAHAIAGLGDARA
ncbi:signal recognition particle-docking protein FtsY [Rhizobium sp. AC44/96]|uniref:signal recognition particle-docking protein FtsY n=1 Tax=Rhizobium sp. AC44/96 TaxID=1841654 RepID=UPI00080F7946|nr:signal recognition particle-docking protein FtsY [Rhizobium sp. AC44/96]OCJ03126.1 signal recognition particle-docking protein FtsY [Rhizobium sp. AC44/96]